MKISNTQKDQYCLFIDESGTANPATEGLYILAGCFINKLERPRIKILADQIKFKYWGKTDIIFHSNEIGRQKGNFDIFKDNVMYASFINDLEVFLLSVRFEVFFILVDKKKAKESGWNEAKVYKDTTISLVRNFILSLLAIDAKGEMIIESASAEKDKYLLDAFAYFLSAGIKQPYVKYESIQDIITSVSFVTKKNHDIEEQIADLFGYAAKLKYQDESKLYSKNGLYEMMMRRILKQRIYAVPIQIGKKKNVYLDEINSFLILP